MDTGCGDGRAALASLLNLSFGAVDARQTGIRERLYRQVRWCRRADWSARVPPDRRRAVKMIAASRRRRGLASATIKPEWSRPFPAQKNRDECCDI